MYSEIITICENQIKSLLDEVKKNLGEMTQMSSQTEEGRIDLNRMYGKNKGIFRGIYMMEQLIKDIHKLEGTILDDYAEDFTDPDPYVNEWEGRD